MKHAKLSAFLLLCALTPARPLTAATFQENFDSGTLGTSLVAQSDPGFTYQVSMNTVTASDSLWMNTSSFSSGSVSVSTTFSAAGDFTTTVTGYNDLNSRAVNSFAAGNLGLRMMTAQGSGSVYFSGGGVMGASFNFPATGQSTTWGVPLSVYDIYRLQIARIGQTLSLGFYDDGGFFRDMQFSDPSFTSDAKFSLFLEYTGTPGNHTISDYGWFDNLSVTASDIIQAPEPNILALLAAMLTCCFVDKERRKEKP